MSTPKPFHQLALRVYYEDTDFSGRAYHASYLRFMERGRTEWLRALGFEHGALAGEQGLVFAVRRLEIDYLAPAVIDDLLSVETRVAELRGAAIDFAQSVLRGHETLAAARVRVVALRNGRPIRIPSALKARLDAAL
jgi:acyl-CoA thioester hydrolase